MAESRIIFNGVDGSTGEYLQAPLSPQEFARAVARTKFETSSEGRGRPAPGVDEKDLATAGWCVVFAEGQRDGLQDALNELLEHRKRQVASEHREYYQVYDGQRALRPGETKWEWLARRGVSPGAAFPDEMPLYVLLVGSPQEIPFDFQFQLGIQRAVGRLHFDTLEDYRHYARKVVQQETAPQERARRAVLFGVNNPDDDATTFTTKDLIQPLLGRLRARTDSWEIESVLEENATKAQLARLIGQGETPDLLFTASHGMGPNWEDPPGPLGSILCQDWPGPVKWREAIPDDFYFGASDVPENADLSGLVSFHFACYTGGLPTADPFRPPTSKQRPLLPEAYLAKLPQKELACGALAVIGHVERAWCSSFIDPKGDPRPSTHVAVLASLMQGLPVGAAARYWSERYADIEPLVTRALARLVRNQEIDTEAFAAHWIDAADAKSYLVLGDPAVRIGAAP